MKIGILTFHCAINYGAVLQAYGLQEHLRSMGHEVAIVHYCPDYLLKPYGLFRIGTEELGALPAPAALKKILWELLTAPIRWRRKQAFRKFGKKNLMLSELDLNDPGHAFDCFVFGSDQIWNLVLTNGFDRVYWGDFPAAKNRKLVAYAASAGSIPAIAGQEKELTERLSAFAAIGVREQTLFDFLKKASPALPLSVVLDPVLLAGKHVFEKIIDPISPTKKFLFLFQLGRDEKIVAAAEAIAAEKHLELLEMNSSSESLRGRGVVNVATPGQFVAYIRQAAYVVTSSYHGTVFSILFHKDFNVVCRDAQKGERVAGLLSTLGLADRMAYVGEKADTGAIDYVCVEEKYKEHLSASRQYLADNLKNA